MSENKSKLDPRLAGIHKGVVFQVYEKVVQPLLVAAKMMDMEEQPLSPMTDETLNLLLSTLVTSMAVALSKAEIKVPAGYSFDEINLIDNMAKGFGIAAIEANEAENYLSFRFDGPGALIQSLKLPLVIDAAMSERIDRGDDVISIEVGKKPIITGRGLIDWPDGKSSATQ